MQKFILMNKQKTDNDFQKIISENKGIIYKVSNAYCSIETERQDLIQEIIIQIWKSFPNYNNKYKISTWIYRIALNVAISLYRKQNSKKKLTTVSIEDYQLSDENENIEKELQIKQLYKFIHELKELDRALILLYLEEKNYKEISEILGISHTNVATKISRIKILLKQKFTD